MATSYPCGSIEEFVLSSNRRKLLGIENDTKDNDDSQEIQHPSIISGSDEHLYFHLLQITLQSLKTLLNFGLSAHSFAVCLRQDLQREGRPEGLEWYALGRGHRG